MMRRALIVVGACGLLVLGAFAARGARSWLKRRPAAMGGFEAVVLAQGAACARAWPGYEPFKPPLLLAFSRGSSLIGAGPRHPWFFRGFGDAVPVARSLRRFEPSFSFLEDFDLDGMTVTVVRVKDGQTPAEAARYYLHEHFHKHQGARFKQREAGPYPVEDPLDMTLAALESLRLADWVESGDAEAMRDFAALRTRRRELFPGTAAELSEEWLEGVASYVERAGAEATSSSAIVRAVLIQALRDRGKIFEVRKFRLYAVGAALCRWLEAENVRGWRQEVEGGRAPSELVLARLDLPRAQAFRRVEAIIGSGLFAAGRKAARRELDVLAARRAQAQARYARLPGRRLVFDLDQGPGPGFSGDWFDFPNGDQLLIAALWSLDNPVLRFRLVDGKGIWFRQATHDHEFVVPTEARITLDGRPYAGRRGRTAFRSFTIDERRISLAAGPGVLDDDGTRMRLSFPDFIWKAAPGGAMRGSAKQETAP
ncbi:MAG: hypothetical protein NTY77_18610 [Elusimicrobia bacterium]|nr:hypothetical protein [Elusimicrobiota bacterium]